ncbi:hypothetical protein [Gaiella sp.]|uniref:hypothetical protein n=1 Tax=Gaiella sp. TaxID=2663207 RepID=UPI003983656C
MNTIAATSQRIPRPALIAVAVLVAAFVALMVVRVGVLGGSPSTTATLAPTATPTPAKTAPAANATPKVVLLPNLPAPVARALRYSKVVVVSMYLGQAPGDRAAALVARRGARFAGAGFVAVNVGSDKNAGAFSSFTGAVTPPTLLVVRRPGKIVTQIHGRVESELVAQAARNAGARR